MAKKQLQQQQIALQLQDLMTKKKNHQVQQVSFYLFYFFGVVWRGMLNQDNEAPPLLC